MSPSAGWASDSFNRLNFYQFESGSGFFLTLHSHFGCFKGDNRPIFSGSKPQNCLLQCVAEPLQ